MACVEITSFNPAQDQTIFDPNDNEGDLCDTKVFGEMGWDSHETWSDIKGQAGKAQAKYGSQYGHKKLALKIKGWTRANYDTHHVEFAQIMRGFGLLWSLPPPADAFYPSKDATAPDSAEGATAPDSAEGADTPPAAPTGTGPVIPM